MEVKTLIKFRDLKAKKDRKIGDTFIVSSDRFEEINTTKYGILVEEIIVPKNGKESNEDVLEFKNMTSEELQIYAEEKGIDLGKATSQEGILRKILEVKEVEESIEKVGD